MARTSSSPLARAAAREIGRVTLVRLTLYYLAAGAVLLLLSALLPDQPPAVAPPPAGDTAALLERLRSGVALFPQGAPRWIDALFQMFGALLLAVPIAFVYVRTRTRVKYDRSLVQTVIVLPIVVTAILVVVRDSLALAFSLAGIVAAVRFRNTLRESGDAVYIFGAIGIGFAAGIHALSVAAVLSVFFVAVELGLWKLDFSADFERTFARLCLPSGADLADIPVATGDARDEPPPPPDRRDALLRLYVDRADAARPAIEAVLSRDSKRWLLEGVEANGGSAPVLTYRVRPRKSIGLERLREHLLREAAPHVVAADDPPER